MALRDAVDEAANSPRCQAMEGEAVHWLRAICSADAFARLSVLHRTCGKILYWDDSEYWEEGWEEEEWEWERKELPLPHSPTRRKHR